MESVGFLFFLVLVVVAFAAVALVCLPIFFTGTLHLAKIFSDASQPEEGRGLKFKIWFQSMFCIPIAIFIVAFLPLPLILTLVAYWLLFVLFCLNEYRILKFFSITRIFTLALYYGTYIVLYCLGSLVWEVIAERVVE